jgi:hypothetical protein
MLEWNIATLCEPPLCSKLGILHHWIQISSSWNHSSDQQPKHPVEIATVDERKAAVSMVLLFGVGGQPATTSSSFDATWLY